MGETQYNYNKRYYQAFPSESTSHYSPSGGEYSEYQVPRKDNKNKYLYDNWISSLFFGCMVIACNLGLIIFGILLAKNNNEPDLLIPNSETIAINKK